MDWKEALKQNDGRHAYDVDTGGIIQRASDHLHYHVAGDADQPVYSVLKQHIPNALTELGMSESNWSPD